MTYPHLRLAPCVRHTDIVSLFHVHEIRGRLLESERRVERCGDACRSVGVLRYVDRQTIEGIGVEIANAAGNGRTDQAITICSRVGAVTTTRALASKIAAHPPGQSDPEIMRYPGRRAEDTLAIRRIKVESIRAETDELSRMRILATGCNVCKEERNGRSKCGRIIEFS